MVCSRKDAGGGLQSRSPDAKPPGQLVATAFRAPKCAGMSNEEKGPGKKGERIEVQNARENGHFERDKKFLESVCFFSLQNKEKEKKYIS